MRRISLGKARNEAARTGLPQAAGAFPAGCGVPKCLHRGLTGLVAVVVALGLAATGAAAAGASTAAAGMAGAGTVSAAGRGHCTRTVTGVHRGALVASAGSLCLDQATQYGPVRVWPGASLTVTASVISGAVTTTRARSVRICGSTIIGPLRASATKGPVTAGTGQASCRGDTGHGPLVITGSARRVQVSGLRQTGPVRLTGNAAGLTLTGGSVGGTVTVRGNQGHGQLVISANTISGALVCTANQPAPGDRHQPNTVPGTAGGQCATLVPPRTRRQAGAPLPQDLSGTLPNLNYGQAVGDFTGAGHDQLAYAQNGQLNIANVNKFGGAVVSSVPTDLMATPNDGFTQGVGRNERRMTVWWNDCCHYDQYAANGSTYGLTSVKVAASASDIYMAGATWNGADPLDTYQLHLYRLPHDGSCASAACAEATVNLPSEFEPPSGRVIVATSLATGVVGGRTLIAVGLSDEGIYIFDDQLNVVAHITDMAGGEAQTPPTALAFGPPSPAAKGSAASLVGGVESPIASAFTWQLNPDGTEGFHSVAGIGWGTAPVVMGAASAQVNGQTVSVFTRSNGDVVVFNPTSGALISDLPGGQQVGQPTGLTPLTPWNGDPGNQELVVGKLGGTGDEVLQYLNGALTEVPIGSGGATTGTADQVYAWWPGYAAGRLRVANHSAGAVSIAMASRQDPGYGCWLDAPVTQPAVPAFPVDSTQVDAGAVSADFFAGALTAGTTGDCASAQPGSTGERAAYVVITPAGDSADEHIVKLTAGADGTLSIPNQPGLPGQVGGYLTASLSQVSPGPGSLGTWQLTVTGSSAPAAAAAPAVAGYRLTAAPDPANYTPPTSPAADDPCRPVYRFDVTGAQWTNVAAAGQVAAQLPPMTAQGSTDGGKTWQDLGQLMPSAVPAVAGGTVTLGPASFFFQNAPNTATAPGVWTAAAPSQCPGTGQAPVTEVRVVSGGLASAPVMLDGLTAPPLDSTLATQVQAVAAVPDGNGGAAAVARADGVDQAGLTLQLTPSGSGGIISPGDPRYGLVYYRDQGTNDLVTGLYQPGHYDSHTAVGPYPADGGAVDPTRNYLVTTSTSTQHLTPVMNDTGTTTAAPGSPFAVAASSNPLIPVGTADGGISITGCASNPCTLTDPTSAAALYQAGGSDSGPVTGLLVSAAAITSPACLPLKTGTANTHNINSASLNVTAGQAKLGGTDASKFWPSDSIDTALVTAGELVPATDMPVAGGNPC